MPITVHHDEAAGRFEIEIDGARAVAEYRDRGDALVFTHTFVPPSLRGRGLAAALVEAGLKYAKAHERKIVPQCSYVEAFIARRPEFAELVSR